MKKLILLFGALMLLAGYSAYAAVLKGKIYDAEGEELPGASVTILTLPDSTRFGGAMADYDGAFEITGLTPNNYNATFSMMGLKDLPLNFEIKSENDTIIFDNVILSEDNVMLSEVVVTAIRPALVVKEDTLEYNADSYHTNPNATVEDLLKKLPGVDVGTDGTISSGGKSVTKILVNGKEFFSDDPQAATKNLTADMIEKVQVIDKKSDLALLTGVDDGEEETVINLTVKKDRENGWFGTVKAGYGTDNRYEASVNANLFKNGNQVSFIAGANNINELGFGDMGRARFRDFGGNNGITTSQRIGVNFNVGKDEIFRVGGNVFYTHSSRESTNKSETQYLFPDSVSYQSGFSRTIDKGHNIRADFRMQWNIDDNNTLDFRPKFSMNYRDSELNDTSALRYQGADGNLVDVNSIQNLQNNHGFSYQIDGDLIYNHKFANKKGRSFSTQFKYSFQDTKQHGTTWSDIEYYLLTEDDPEQIFRYVDNHQWSNSVTGRLTWTEPLGNIVNGNYLNIAYNVNYQWSNADKYTYNLDPYAFLDNATLPNFSNPPFDPPYEAMLDSTISNRFRNNFFNQEIQVGYKKVSKALNLEVGLLFSPSSSKSDNLMDDAKSIPTRWVYNVGPYARFRYKFGEKSSVSANYRARTSQPSLTQLQPVPDVSDPLNIIVGNPYLKPTFTQSINVRFTDYNLNYQRSISAMLNASYALNSIVRKTTTDSSTGGRITEYENADGNLNLMGMFMINQPFNNRSWRFNARLNARYSTSPGYINGDFNRSGNLILSPAAGITFSSNIFQISLNPTYSFNMATNTLPSQENRYIHTYGFTGDASLYFDFGLEIGTDINYSYNTGYSRGFDRKQALWNATASYSLLSDRSLTLSVRVYDILQQRQNISRTVSANMITDNEYNDLTRYFMFGIAWRFNSFSKGKTAKNAEGEFFDGMPPQGPPPGEVPQGPPPGGMGGPGGMGRPPM